MWVAVVSGWWWWWGPNTKEKGGRAPAFVSLLPDYVTSCLLQAWGGGRSPGPQTQGVEHTLYLLLEVNTLGHLEAVGKNIGNASKRLTVMGWGWGVSPLGPAHGSWNG